MIEDPYVLLRKEGQCDNEKKSSTTEETRHPRTRSWQRKPPLFVDYVIRRTVSLAWGV